jgi:hypothetical protein
MKKNWKKYLFGLIILFSFYVLFNVQADYWKTKGKDEVAEYYQIKTQEFVKDFAQQFKAKDRLIEKAVKEKFDDREQYHDIIRKMKMNFMKYKYKIKMEFIEINYKIERILAAKRYIEYKLIIAKARILFHALHQSQPEVLVGLQMQTLFKVIE